MAAPWYIRAFDERYLTAYAHRERADVRGEVRGALALLGLRRRRTRRRRILDLGCGTGRHARRFREAGMRVAGLDLSGTLLARCRARGIPCARGDMRALPFLDGTFAAVVSLFSSFGYFVREADHGRTMRQIARVLAPGGAALLDLMDPDTVRATLVPRERVSHPAMRMTVRRSLAGRGVRIVKRMRLERPEHPPTAWKESVRLFSPGEIARMARAAGMRHAGTWGALDGRPYAAGRTRLVVLLVKPTRPPGGVAAPRGNRRRARAAGAGRSP